MAGEPERPTFCRFGVEEQLTLEDLRDLIRRKELAETDLLQVGDSTEWIAARDIDPVRALFPPRLHEPPPAQPKQSASYRRAARPNVDPPVALPDFPEPRPFVDTRHRLIWLGCTIAGGALMFMKTIAILRGGPPSSCAVLIFLLFGWIIVCLAIAGTLSMFEWGSKL